MDLVDLIIPWKHGLTINQFPYHTAESPHVSSLPVGFSNQQLWTSVPASGHVLCQIVVLLRQEACETEIAYFQYRVVRVKEDVFRFDVSMNNVFGVEKLDALYYLVDDEVDQRRLQSVFVLLDEVEQVVLKVLEDKVDLALFLECLPETHHELAPQHLEHTYLSLNSIP
jgi:hypothetical protein